MLKRLLRSEPVTALICTLVAWYFRLVARSCRAVVEPADAHARVVTEPILVVTTWHGEHFMVPFLKPYPDWPVEAFISRSRDGELNARVVEKLGIGAIRASGGRTGAEVGRRGGVAGMVAALRRLAAGVNIMLTADVPKGPAKVVGEGVIQIARRSGAPIIPVAAVTTHNIRFTRSWDRAALSLPFGRFAKVYGEFIRVPADADAAGIEAARLRLEAELKRITARAYELAGARP